ncbi:ribonuclease H-like domain-containing protein [Tanacetum coccineum]
MVPRAVLMKSGLVSVNTARQVNAAHSKTTVNAARPKSHFSKPAHSTVKRPIHKNTTFKNSNFNQRVNTVKDKNVNIVRPKAVVNAARPNNYLMLLKKHVNGNPQMDLQDQGVIDSGFSRHMTRNMSYLTNFEEIDGGYVAFGGNPKRGKITGKATSDELNHWHRRLRHINFKTMNKLVKGNLARGLPSKLFEISQTCVACQKEKQHRASCKFDGKADERFFVGYSINSKAFRVFNSRTMIVEENSHIKDLVKIMSRFMKDTMRVSRKVLVKSPPVRRALSSRLKLRHLRKVRVRRKYADISSGIGLQVPRYTQLLAESSNEL